MANEPAEPANADGDALLMWAFDSTDAVSSDVTPDDNATALVAAGAALLMTNAL